MGGFEVKIPGMSGGLTNVKDHRVYSPEYQVPLGINTSPGRDISTTPLMGQWKTLYLYIIWLQPHMASHTADFNWTNVREKKHILSRISRSSRRMGTVIRLVLKCQKRLAPNALVSLFTPRSTVVSRGVYSYL